MSNPTSPVKFDNPGEGFSDRLSKLNWISENLDVVMLCIVAAIIAVIALANTPKIISALSKH